MRLSAYLERIGYRGKIAVDSACLRAVHRCHLQSIPYENIDVQLQRPLDQDIERIFDKLVNRRRGGWCYEMNGLLGWALTTIGFDVMRLTGGVMRKERGDGAFGNHLVLCVRLDQPYVADAGLGDGPMEAYPLLEGEFQQDARHFRLEQLNDGAWRFHNHEGSAPPSFDFHQQPANEALLAHTCESLQTDPESLFRQNLTCQLMTDVGAVVLLGRVLSLPGAPRQLLGSAQQLEDVLARQFGVQDPEITDLWPQVTARHDALFGDRPDETIRFGPA